MAGPRLWRHTPCNPCQRANGVPQEPSFAASASSLAGIGVWRVLQTFHSEVQSIGERKMEMWRQEIFHVSTSPLLHFSTCTEEARLQAIWPLLCDAFAW